MTTSEMAERACYLLNELESLMDDMGIETPAGRTTVGDCMRSYTVACKQQVISWARFWERRGE